MTTPDGPVHVAGQLDLTGTPVPPEAVAQPNPDHARIDVEISVRVPADACWGGQPPERWDARTLADELSARYAGDLPGFLADWGLTGDALVAVTAGGLTAYPRELT